MNYKIVAVHESGDVTRAILLLDCKGSCQIPIRKGGHTQYATKIWGWDGHVEAPTVTPSIDCPKCGFHRTLTKGNWG